MIAVCISGLSLLLHDLGALQAGDCVPRSLAKSPMMTAAGQNKTHQGVDKKDVGRGARITIVNIHTTLTIETHTIKTEVSPGVGPPLVMSKASGRDCR